MPIQFDSDQKKWILNLTIEENINLPMLLKYLETKINTTCVFIDKNHKANTIADLRLYNDEDFFNS
jgi:hypothetical protein